MMTKITRTDVKNSVKDGAKQFAKDYSAATLTLGTLYLMFVAQPLINGTMAATDTIRGNARIWFE